MATSLDPDAPDGNLLGGTLWHLEFADGNFCVATDAT